MLTRWLYKMRFLWHYAKSLNARAKVEEELFQMSRGLKPLPDTAKCRELAQRLGSAVYNAGIQPQAREAGLSAGMPGCISPEKP